MRATIAENWAKEVARPTPSLSYSQPKVTLPMAKAPMPAEETEAAKVGEKPTSLI